MNAIKNFFHAFGDIIFGLIIVAVAVFVIGFQVTNDFDILSLAKNSYNKVYALATGTSDESSDVNSEILIDPDAIQEDLTTDSSNGDDSIVEDVENPDQVVSSEDPSATTDTTDGTNTTVAEVPAIRNIVISPNSTADQVTTGLFANGIIGSKEEFLAEYARLPVGRFIKSGTFQIPTGSTPAEILAIIAP